MNRTDTNQRDRAEVVCDKFRLSPLSPDDPRPANHGNAGGRGFRIPRRSVNLDSAALAKARADRDFVAKALGNA